MYASYICNELYGWIQEGEHYGKIHSIFKSTINLLSNDGKFISIINKDKPMSPNCIKLSKNIDFTNLDISMGDSVKFRKSSLDIKNITVNYEESLLWDKSVIFITNKDTYENYELKLEMIKDFLLHKGTKNGIFNLMEFISKEFLVIEENNLEDRTKLFIKDRFLNFIHSFKNSEIHSINSKSKKIIGFGAGLTPAMDDFLSGLMISNIYISHYLGANIEDAYKLNKEIILDIDNKTTRVSEEMLKQSSIGESNEDIRNLMISLIGISTGETLYDLLEKVIDYGHSSGTDILCGIFTGAYTLLEKYKEKENLK